MSIWATFCDTCFPLSCCKGILNRFTNKAPFCYEQSQAKDFTAVGGQDNNFTYIKYNMTKNLTM